MACETHLAASSQGSYGMTVVIVPPMVTPTTTCVPYLRRGSVQGRETRSCDMSVQRPGAGAQGRSGGSAGAQRRHLRQRPEREAWERKRGVGEMGAKRRHLRMIARYTGALYVAGSVATSSTKVLAQSCPVPSRRGRYLRACP